MEVRINNERADTTKSVIAITKQGYDFTDLRKRFLGRTNRFTLPRTSANTKIFESPLIINSGGRGFEKNYSCVVTEQGVTMLTGDGILNEAGQDYKLQVIDNAKELFDSLNKKVNTLAIDGDDDFFYNAAGYEAIKGYNDSVWIWASDFQSNQFLSSQMINIDEGILDSAYITYFRPHFSIDKLFTRMFENEGWTLINNNDLQNLVISSNHEKFYFTSYEKTFDQTIVGDGTDQQLDLDGFSFKHPDLYLLNDIMNIEPYSQLFRLRGAIQCTSDFEFIVRSETANDVKEEVFNISVNDTEVDITSKLLRGDNGYNNISFYVNGTGSITFDNTLLYSLLEEQDFGDWNPSSSPPDVVTPPFEDYLVKAYDNMPDINKIDLFKEICLLAGLGFNTNNVRKELTFFEFEDFSRSNSIDWSDKFIKDSETVTTQTSGLGKTTFLSYSNDETVKTTAGQANFQVDSDNIPDEETLITSLFSASEDFAFQYPGSTRLTASSMFVYDYHNRVNDCTIRLKRLGSAPFNSTPDFVTGFNSLTWTSLLNNKYKFLAGVLGKARRVKAQFNLKKLDVITFDFSKLVYIEQLKSYFFVEKINNYVEGRTTTCYLVKVN